MNTPFRKTFDASKVYTIGDMHLQHRNLCRGTSDWPDKENCRDFDTIEEMNYKVFDSVLTTVPYDADLFIVGDIIFGDKSKLTGYIERLRPRRLYYLFGNHCLWMRDKPEVLSLFDWTGDYLEIFVKRQNGSRKLCSFFHYPVRSFNDEKDDSYFISGHTHGNLPYPEWQKALDVGWDVFRKPISFNEIDNLLKNKKYEKQGHH